jgi:hypothetical protein
MRTMSKITFRADDDLVRRLEAFDASKSEVMREALRRYLDDAERETPDADANADSDSIASGGIDPRMFDDALAARIDRLVAERLAASADSRPREAQDVNVTIAIEGLSDSATARVEETADAREIERREPDEPAQTRRKTCGQCGDEIASDHVYCPNCGEKATHRVFCDCGDELRSDWVFCPGCGRRTPAADVLDRA